MPSRGTCAVRPPYASTASDMAPYLDARTEAMPSRLSARTCIIGAGPAGLTLALQLAERGDDVLLVEAGSFELEGATQALYVGRNIGLNYYDLAACRLRYFGGTSNHWGGYCRPNDTIDYEGRPELGIPAWPIGKADLDPYVLAASKIVDIDLDVSMDIERTARRLGGTAQDLIERETDRLETKTFFLSQHLRFGRFLREMVRESANLRCVLNLNAVRLEKKEGIDAVAAVEAATTTGRRIRIEAQRFVLAAHAIENAKLLMQSTSFGEAGCGNRFDHVGRYFMEHAHLFASRMVPSARFPHIYDAQFGRVKGLNVNLGLSARGMRETGALSYYCRFNPYYSQGAETEGALTLLEKDALEPLSLDYVDALGTVLLDLPGATRKSVAKLSRSLAIAHPRYFTLEHRIEQAPNPSSRVVLSDREDGIGGRHANLDWQLSEIDVRTYHAGQEMVVNELSALGMGRFQVEDIDIAIARERSKGHYHHIGTTRMAANAREGVVDKDLKVFDVANLYVCGSSVFTTAGYSGPTMMIVALSLRLADALEPHPR